MKSLLILSFIVFPLVSFSQITPGLFYVKSSHEVGTGKNSWVKAYRNNIPGPVMTSFVELFPEADDVTWYVNNKDITGYFNYGKKDIVINYKKDGLLLSIRKTYEAALLDKKISEFVKIACAKEFSMQYVTEVVRQKDTAFEISLDSGKEWLILKMVQAKDGSFSQIEKEKFKKG